MLPFYARNHTCHARYNRPVFSYHYPHLPNEIMSAEIQAIHANELAEQWALCQVETDQR